MPRRHLAVGFVATGCIALLAVCSGPLLAVTSWRALPLMLQTDPAGLLGAVALQAAWVLALWLAAGTVLHLAAGLPGFAGRCASVLARAITPRLLRRTLDVCLGVGLVAVPAGPALAASATPTGSPHPAVTQTLPAVPAPVLAPLPLVPDLDRPAARPPALVTPFVAASPPPPARPPVAASPSPPASQPAPLVTANTAVVVHAGDTLWSIARAQLPSSERSGPAVAAAWPRWWQANHAQIGDDPDLIHPGQRLTPPTSAGR